MHDHLLSFFYLDFRVHIWWIEWIIERTGHRRKKRNTYLFSKCVCKPYMYAKAQSVIHLWVFSRAITLSYAKIMLRVFTLHCQLTCIVLREAAIEWNEAVAPEIKIGIRVSFLSLSQVINARMSRAPRHVYRWLFFYYGGGIFVWILSSRIAAFFSLCNCL